MSRQHSWHSVKRPDSSFLLMNFIPKYWTEPQSLINYSESPSGPKENSSCSKPKTFDICFHHFHHCTADGVFYTKLSLSKIGSFFLVQMNCCLKYAWLTSLWQCDHMLLSGRHWSSDSCGFFEELTCAF